MGILPIALVGIGAALWAYFADQKTPNSAMVGADESGAFASYPKGCTGEPVVKACSVPNGSVYRVCAWECLGTPYSHYAVAQEHLSPNWIGFKVTRGKRKFWRGNGSPADIARMCIELGVQR